uniref:Sodefrin-like factor beta isoform 05 n=1 Tax=Pleurodeles waltl TaxID=8319 RepID=A0A0A0QTG2_PLEWA|nr:sodefrin precursor-like factor beta isoform 05 [Pleurodeles waltl]
MRATLAAVVMFQALITGDCLLCEHCFNVHDSSCSGIFKQCPPGVTRCVKGLENNTVGSNTVLTAFKGCLNPSQNIACDRELSIKNSMVSFQISRTCRNSDFCNGGVVKVPAVKETLNGYKCEECFNDQSTDECTVTGKVQCIGKQTTCSSFYGTVARPGEPGRQYSGKACTTPDFCKFGLSNLPGTQASSYWFLCFPAETL